MDRPILFSAPMVRAILDGTKTQTRRIVKPRKDRDMGCELAPCELAGEANGGEFRNAYRAPGDRLWVRETWQGPLMSADEWEQHGNDDPQSLPSRFNSPAYCEYAADGGPPPEFMTADDDLVCRWRPSIHMPRWASRITLEVTGVRVERLQDIWSNDADCIAEGIEELPQHPSGTRLWRNYLPGHPQAWSPSLATPGNSFSTLWRSINGDDSWAANPWVWVVEFRRV